MFCSATDGTGVSGDSRGDATRRGTEETGTDENKVSSFDKLNIFVTRHLKRFVKHNLY